MEGRLRHQAPLDLNKSQKLVGGALTCAYSVHDTALSGPGESESNQQKHPV